MFKRFRDTFGTSKAILYVLVAWRHRNDPAVNLWDGDPKNYEAIMLPFGGGSIETAVWNDFGTRYVEAWTSQPS